MSPKRLPLFSTLIILFAVTQLSGQRAEAQTPQSAAAPPATAAAEQPPTVDQILEKYVKAIGGKAAIMAPTSRVMKGTITVAAIGAKGTVEMYAKAPNKELNEMASAALGNSRDGFNGTVAWEEEDGEVKETTPAFNKREADFYLPAKIHELYPKLEVRGKEKVGNADAWVLEAPRSGRPRRWYFDTTTGMLLRTEELSAAGKITTREDYEDYRPVDGLQIAFTVRGIETSEVEYVIKFSEIKHNVPIDDAKFDKPAARTP